MFITENFCSKFAMMSFWAPVLKSSAGKGIPKKSKKKFYHMRVGHACVSNCPELIFSLCQRNTIEVPEMRVLINFKI